MDGYAEVNANSMGDLKPDRSETHRKLLEQVRNMRNNFRTQDCISEKPATTGSKFIQNVQEDLRGRSGSHGSRNRALQSTTKASAKPGSETGSRFRHIDVPEGLQRPNTHTMTAHPQTYHTLPSEYHKYATQGSDSASQRVSEGTTLHV
jgi:hypothetical protein